MADKSYIRKKKEVDSNSTESVFSEITKGLPSAVELEMSLIGAMLIDCESCTDQIEELSEDCFYDARCRAIFSQIKKMVSQKDPVDCLTVTQCLSDSGDLEKIGGLAWVADLTSKAGMISHSEYYSKILMQKRIQRDLIKASYRIIKDALAENVNVDQLISNAQSIIFKASDTGIRKDTRHVTDIVQRTMDKIEKAQTSSGLTGVPSGYTSIDRLTMGWQKGNLIILGARPSVGKTAFALNLARNAAVEFNRPIAFFSLEMQDVEILQRLLVAESGIPGDKVSGKSKMANDDWIALESGLSRLIQSPIYIDETPQIPIAEFASKAKHLVREKGVEMIFVDYLQLMKGESSQQSFREQEVASISRSLKGLAKELDIPIMALSQLSRGIMNRAGSNGRPVLSDLRESGSIEQDADIVVFIHRPEAIGFTDQETMSETNTEIIFAKHRNGELATIPMDFEGEYVRFYELGQGLKMDTTVTYESRMNQSSVITSNCEFDVNGLD